MPNDLKYLAAKQLDDRSKQLIAKYLTKLERDNGKWFKLPSGPNYKNVGAELQEDLADYTVPQAMAVVLHLMREDLKTCIKDDSAMKKVDAIFNTADFVGGFQESAIKALNEFNSQVRELGAKENFPIYNAGLKSWTRILNNVAYRKELELRKAESLLDRM